jgi:hypothetical protein
VSLELFKFVVQPMFIERDDDGEILGEQAAEPIVFYSPTKLEQWAHGFPDHLADLNDRPR